MLRPARTPAMDSYGSPAALSGGGLELTGPVMSASFVRALQLGSAAISLAFAALLIYTIQTDGSPFRSSLLTPWMVTTIFDFYFVMSVVWGWICIRERSLGVKLFWIVALFCLGTVSTWFYVWTIAIRLRPGDPLSKLVMGASR